MLYIAQTPSYSQLQRNSVELTISKYLEHYGKEHLQNVNETELLYAMFTFLLSMFLYLKKSPETELLKDILRNLFL